MRRAGWTRRNCEPVAGLRADRVDYAQVVPYRMQRLQWAARRFHALPDDDPRRADFDAFCVQQRHWLDDYVLFMALHEAHAHIDWWHWPAPLVLREPGALQQATRQHAARIAVWRFAQWCFHRQWLALKAYALERGVQIVGDVPIFVAAQSADVWSHPRLFDLDGSGEPNVVAGVPPDYFSVTGQRWGNPLYRLERTREGRLRLVGGTHARAPSSWSTSCASTTSAVSPRTGRSPRIEPDRGQRPLAQGPGRGAVQGAAGGARAGAASSRRTWA